MQEVKTVQIFNKKFPPIGKIKAPLQNVQISANFGKIPLVLQGC
jgi:hypothetical protein